MIEATRNQRPVTKYDGIVKSHYARRAWFGKLTMTFIEPSRAKSKEKMKRPPRRTE